MNAVPTGRIRTTGGREAAIEVMSGRYVRPGALPRSNPVPLSGTTLPPPETGPELLVELDRAAPRPLRAQLEDALRDAVRGGRLLAGAALPSSRTLAGDLAVSRRMVVEAYAQLVAEGYLVARRGAGTFVALATRPAAVDPGRAALATEPRPA